MLDDKTYREWTKAFDAGSYFEGRWEQGSEMRFLAPGKEGNLQGIFSRIKENKAYQFISIEHLGMVSNGIVNTTSDEVKKWEPSLENYTFAERGGNPELNIEMQVTPEYKPMFEEMWPKALQALKGLCEE